MTIQSDGSITAASGGLIAPKRLRYAGQSGSVKLNGQVVDPGPWRVNVSFDVVAGDQEGGLIEAVIGFYPRSALGSLLDTPATGCQAPGPSSGFLFVPSEAWYLPITRGSWPATSAWSDATGFAFGHGMAFENGSGRWIGVTGSDTSSEWWTDLPDMHTGAAIGSFPAGIDTGNADPLADFDNPVVGVFFTAAGASLSAGVYPPPFLTTQPATPRPGTVTLYNNIVTHKYPLRNGVLSDQLGFAENGAPLTYYSPHRRDVITVVGGVVVDTPYDATCFTNSAFYAYADISQLPDAPTRAIDTAQAGAGLIAIG